MDKWDAIVNRIKQGMLAEEPEAALAGGLELLAEFGRTMDRIADALQPTAEPAPVEHDL